MQSFGEVGGMNVTIKDLTYSVANHASKKRETINLLTGITGFFEPRAMSALMGPSGSGKTTLLDLLAGRKTAGRATGEILFAGNKPTRAFLRRYTGYVEQFDTLLPGLTVEEMLLYTAELTRPRQEGRAAKRDAVEELLDKLALTTCRGVKIGNPLEKGISGGQAKRTNIGIALITNPRVLMLDEPTSGLDSFTANEVISLVKGLTSEGVTIVATIHSPTAYAFSLFDRRAPLRVCSLMMLVKGRLVYFGASGAPAVDYMRSLPAAHTSGLSYQPNLNEVVRLGIGFGSILLPLAAYCVVHEEWFVDLFALADRRGDAAVFADAYEASELKKVTEKRVSQLVSERHLVPSAVARELAVRHATVTPWWWSLWVLLRYRTFLNWRDPSFLAARLADKVVMGALLVTLFWGMGADFSLENYLNIAALLFMWCTIPAFGAATFVPSLVMERPLFVRERHDGLYRVSTYLMMKMIEEIGIAIVGSIMMAVIVYFGAKMQGSFLVVWMVYFATLCVGITMAYSISALCPTIDVANAALPTYVATLTFVSGFIIRFDNIPVWWRLCPRSSAPADNSARSYRVSRGRPRRDLRAGDALWNGP
ncbi:hypothetical protein MNEG_0105 [Monoraphidium neglectum]|uniref:ABC transporter domain-containing protein n=1 Tax=Monoraphidium neglectum TaxID=145388 RepID=A0A0D2N6E0_9CHLO|nr:hypothetical protein MNEG_0105 [Monoraphidium neglectum]KIZ07852.1 hypothetical protein MNEG_0105 [Monoraphidium neglectum]|eukprot:XP_013906871.1 hypothetical protein MNEG_0105 [Monoraphidium neglectum]